ncbi:hypothetical protein BJY04DRAFT_18475 [Aspergillus karnatakaensis]|uniref:FAD-dependent oxidoreductase n=1 Tax=Aspergillus karnatakaensis TaxID=1810916 RepID=UPI003CCD0119
MYRQGYRDMAAIARSITPLTLNRGRVIMARDTLRRWSSTSSETPSAPRIAIVGGGPAGLTLGVLLHKRNIPFRIFELRQEPTDEDLAKPSGSLDLHEESGLAALKECGLYDKFLQHTGECSEAQKVSDKDGNILYQDEGELSERPEISRHALTKLLTSHLPPDSIMYGRKLHSTSISKSSVELDFGPHGKQTAALVIGADGAWSRVRSLLTDEKPHYAGTQSITATVTNISTRYPHLADFVGQGSFSALGLRHGVMSQRGPQDSARIYTFLSVPEENPGFLSSPNSVNRSNTISKNQLLTDSTLLGTFGAPLKELVSVACDERLPLPTPTPTHPAYPSNPSTPAQSEPHGHTTQTPHSSATQRT